MNNFSRLFIAFLVLLFSTGITVADDYRIEWKKLYERDGINVYKGIVAECSLVAFKGVAVINAPIMHVMTVLYDMERKPEWVPFLEKAKIVKKISPRKRIEYHLTDSPWPVADREFIFLAEALISKDKKTITINLCPAENIEVAKKSSVIRGELKHGRYILKSVDNGKKTHLTVEILVDPKGLIPKWLVNYTQKKWPLCNINGIREEVKNPIFKVNPLVKNIFQ